MTYEIDIRIRYKDDLFHEESLPDGQAMVEQLKEDFDAVTDNAATGIEVVLLREGEV